MKFRFYSAAYIKEKETYSNASDLELGSLEDAANVLNNGAIIQDDLGTAFTPVYCEKVEE